MKLTSKQYAKILINNASGDNAAVAQKFWFALQKNNQYKDLPKIVAELDKEYARQNDSIFAEIISEHKLSSDEIKEIGDKLAKILNKKIISKNIAKANFGPGIIVRTDEMEIDVSMMGKIESLKQQLNN